MNRIHAEKIALINEDSRVKVMKINEDHLLDVGQKAQLRVQIEEETKLKIQALDEDLAQSRIAALNRYAEKSTGTSHEITAGWQSAAAESVQASKKQSNMGVVAFNSMRKGAAEAFIAMGNGSKTAGEAMKGFLFNSLADIAEAKGQFLLVGGMATGNPAEIAGGAALLALSGFLRSQAGGASAGGGASGGGGGAGGGAGGGSVGPSGGAPEMKETKKKSVELNLYGNMMGTDETNRWLVERVREASDATDFTIKKIGEK